MYDVIYYIYILYIMCIGSEKSVLKINTNTLYGGSHIFGCPGQSLINYLLISAS